MKPRPLALDVVDDGDSTSADPPRARRWVPGRRPRADMPQRELRSWVHPSELPNFDSIPTYDTTKVRRHGTTAIVLTSAVLIMALASVSLALRTTTPPATAALTRHITSIAQLPSYAQRAARASLELVFTDSGHLSATAAMVIAPGNLAVTTEPIPATASITGSSQFHARFAVSFVSRDRALGFTLVHLSVNLPIAHTDLLPYASNVLAIAPYFTEGTAVPKIAWTPTTLGDPVVESRDGIVSYRATPSAPDLNGWADALAVNDAGSVVALLSANNQWFSAQYIATVAGVIAQNGGCHGALLIEGESYQGGGVLVVKVKPGPATGHLLPGDQLKSIGGVPLDSIDTLLNYLYAEPPRSIVVVTLIRHGRFSATAVTLACQP
jgi:hypothetical protein